MNNNCKKEECCKDLIKEKYSDIFNQDETSYSNKDLKNIIYSVLVDYSAMLTTGKTIVLGRYVDTSNIFESHIKFLDQIGIDPHKCVYIDHQCDNMAEDDD